MKKIIFKNKKCKDIQIKKHNLKRIKSRDQQDKRLGGTRAPDGRGWYCRLPWSYTLNLLNQYTDVSQEDLKQIKCITQTSDKWFSNINNCPSDYTDLL